MAHNTPIRKPQRAPASCLFSSLPARAAPAMARSNGSKKTNPEAITSRHPATAFRSVPAKSAWAGHWSQEEEQILFISCRDEFMKANTSTTGDGGNKKKKTTSHGLRFRLR